MRCLFSLVNKSLSTIYQICMSYCDINGIKKNPTLYFIIMYRYADFFKRICVYNRTHAPREEIKAYPSPSFSNKLQGYFSLKHVTSWCVTFIFRSMYSFFKAFAIIERLVLLDVLKYESKYIGEIYKNPRKYHRKKIK